MGFKFSFNSCSLTQDQISIISIKEISNSQYVVINKISGWQDKIFSLELYKFPLEMDRCGTIVSMPIDTVGYLPKTANDSPHRQIKVIATKNKLKLEEYNTSEKGNFISVVWQYFFKKH